MHNNMHAQHLLLTIATVATNPLEQKTSTKSVSTGMFTREYAKVVRVLVALVFGWASVTASATTTLSHVEDCKANGFDPWQLACSTCSLLPESVVEMCLSCCQSYKTLDKQAKRYQGAVLVDNGFSTTAQEVLRQDQETITTQKKGFKVKKNENGGGSGGGLFQMYAEPSMILWYNTLPVNIESTSMQRLIEDAAEVTTLEGFSRDDIREMLFALLPDK